jgi:hypothetical protein
MISKDRGLDTQVSDLSDQVKAISWIILVTSVVGLIMDIILMVGASSVRDM